MAPVFPTTLAIVGDAFPRMTGTAIGFVITCGWIGLAVGLMAVVRVCGQSSTPSHQRYTPPDFKVPDFSNFGELKRQLDLAEALAKAPRVEPKELGAAVLPLEAAPGSEAGVRASLDTTGSVPLLRVVNETWPRSPSR